MFYILKKWALQSKEYIVSIICILVLLQNTEYGIFAGACIAYTF